MYVLSSPQRDEDLSRPRNTLFFINTTAGELHQRKLHELSNLGNLNSARIAATAQHSTICLNLDQIAVTSHHVRAVLKS